MGLILPKYLLAWVYEQIEPKCCEILREVFEERLIFKLRDKDYFPPLNSKVVKENWGQ